MIEATMQPLPARFDASVMPRSKSAPFLGFIESCHPTLSEEAPSGMRWIHEIKFRRLPHAGAPAKRAACHLHAERTRLDAALPAADHLGATMRLRLLSGARRPSSALTIRHAVSRCWHRQDRGRSANPARACRDFRLALATRTDSSASLLAAVKNRSADERV
jgi:hypothetical protein